MKKVATSPVMDDNSELTKLPMQSLFRLIVNSFTKDESDELEMAERLSADKLARLGSLNRLVEEATNNMTKYKASSVTLNLSSKYLPYVEEVMSKDTGWGRFYDIEWFPRNIPDSVPHKFLCVIRKRGRNE